MVQKVLVIIPFPLNEEGVANRRLQVQSTNIRSDLVFDYVPVRASSSSFMSDHDWILMDVGCFEAGINAEKDGYSGVVIDSTSDSGADALRSVLDIPVIAPGRTSCLYALTLGNSFGILAMDEVGVFSHQQWIAARQLSQFCSAIEPIGGTTDVSSLMSGKEAEILPLMRSAAERAVDKGAEVIILGSTTMHQAGDWLNEELRVPVVNPGPLTYKMIETILALNHSHSRKAYPKPEKTKFEMICGMVDAAERLEKGKNRR